ncbi:hypothetical protein [Litorimonas haliclonae]|uniref:hypothetical protein n=1 Tax=Litorimonas haliclonae TaxID=2081977 RepID=UPI0039EECF05
MKNVRNISLFSQNNPWHRYLRRVGLVGLSTFYVKSAMIVQLALLPLLIYFSLTSGPAKSEEIILVHLVFTPAMGQFGLLVGISYPRKKKSSFHPFGVVFTAMLVSLLVSIIFFLYGFNEDEFISLGAFLIALLGMFSASYFIGLLALILNSPSIGGIGLKSLEIALVTGGAFAFFLTLINSRPDLSASTENLLFSIASIVVAIVAPVQISKLTYEFFQSKKSGKVRPLSNGD